MNYRDVLSFPVNFITAKNVLALRGLKKSLPNVVLRHDYDSMANWQRVLDAERECGVASSNYLLVDKYPIPVKKFREYEKEGFEFGLHQNGMESKSVVTELLKFANKGLKPATTMTPHGWAFKNGEYPPYNNWEVDRSYDGNMVVSMNEFYRFCHSHFGYYDPTYNIGRFYSKSGLTFFEIPYRGVMLIDDSGGVMKPYTTRNVLSEMDAGKVYVFLFHPANMNRNLGLRRKKAGWISRIEWDDKFKH